MRKFALAILASLTIVTSVAHSEENLAASEKILLQVAMQQSIDRQLVDGKYFYFDAATAKVHALYPAKTHPMILRMDNHFVLCTNFRSDDGKAINVDFYVARNDESFVVFDTVVDNREPIKRLMSTGAIQVAK
jgi:hypothetical protein